jgi:tetratricopeptide (TPR) repeat protein
VKGTAGRHVCDSITATGRLSHDTICRTMRGFATLALLLVLASSAWAADATNEEARAHVRRATATYNLGKYRDSAKEYEAAYELTLDQNLLFNVAQCYRLGGENDRAIAAYRSFIRSAPPSEERELAKTKLRELEEQRKSAPSPAAASGPAAQAATPAPSAAPPPTATSPMGALSMDAGTPPSSAAPATVPITTETHGPELARPSPFYKRWPFWTAVGAAVAAGVVLVVVLTRAGNDLTMNPSLGTKDF